MTQDQIGYGVTVRALVAFDDIPARIVVTMTRSTLIPANGAFQSIGNASAPKGRSPYSSFFTAAHLPQFEW